MRALCSLVALLMAGTAFCQFPDLQQRKKNKIKMIIQSSDGGTEYYLYDEQGYELKADYNDSTFKSPNRSSTIYYNAAKKPDSIVTQLGTKSSVETFYYGKDGSFYTITRAGVDSDTSWLNKEGQALKIARSNGSQVNFEYNTKKQLSKKTETAKDERIVTTYTYNTAGHLLSTTMKDQDGDVRTTKYEMNKQGLLTKEFLRSFTVFYSYKYR